MSTFIWRVSSAVLPVSGDTEQCVRKGFGDKSEVNRWTMVGYAARLNWETRTPRFLKESTGHHPTTQPACIENCIIRQLEESVLCKWTRRSSSCSPGGHSIPRCLDRTTVCHTADNHKNLWKYALKLTLTEESFFTLILPQRWCLYEVNIYVYMKMIVLRQSDSVDH